MIQSNTFGNSIIDSMYNQIDFLREKQLLAAVNSKACFKLRPPSKVKVKTSKKNKASFSNF